MGALLFRWKCTFKGNIESKGSFKDGWMDGYWVSYYENGNLHSKGIYVNGDREGIWEFYKESGELDYKFEYY